MSSPTKADKPKNAQKKAKAPTTSSKNAMKALDVSMANCVARDLHNFFGENVRISQLASSTIGDMLIYVCTCAVNKARELLGMNSRKTMTGEAIMTAARVLVPTVSVPAQDGWQDIFDKQVEWNIVHQWKDVRDDERAEAKSHNKKSRVNEIMHEKGNEIAPTVTKRILKKALPCGWRMKNDEPAVALSVLCHLIIGIIVDNIIKHDDQFNHKLQKNGGIMLAPRHIFRAIQSHIVLPHLLGDHINMVGAPVGLLEGVMKRRSSRRGARVQMYVSPEIDLMRRRTRNAERKRARSESASPQSAAGSSGSEGAFSPPSPSLPSPEAFTPTPSPPPSPPKRQRQAEAPSGRGRGRGRGGSQNVRVRPPSGRKHTAPVMYGFEELADG